MPLRLPSHQTAVSLSSPNSMAEFPLFLKTVLYSSVECILRTSASPCSSPTLAYCWTGEVICHVRLGLKQALRHGSDNGSGVESRGSVSTYLDFSPETSAVSLSAYLYNAYPDVQHCAPAPCASETVVAQHTSEVAMSERHPDESGILTHDGGLSYVDVVLSMLWRISKV